MDVPEIDVKEEWISKARDYGEKTGMSSMVVGKTGEYAVIYFLRKHGVQLREDQTPPNRPDYFDILAKGTLIEVKTTRKNKIKIPKDTFDRGRRFWVYIGVKLSLEKKKAWIYGYVKKEGVSKGKVISIHGKNYYAFHLKQLKPVEELLPFLRGRYER